MKYLFLVITFICSYKLLYSEIVFEGLIKLSDKDLQSLTQIDLKKQDYSNSEINQIINDLYDTKLIIDLDYNFYDGKHFFLFLRPQLLKIFLLMEINILVMTNSFKY